jgi:signal transduction histidine kinase/DNA-binding response OmpR family regulator
MTRTEVLVVDDSPTQLEALRALLAASGFGVTTATSGEEALRRLDEGDIGLVLSDVVMPGMSGYALCSEIKRRLGSPEQPPVVLLTSLSDPTDIVRGLECGADNYITKPYDPEHLIARIRHVLDNRALRRQQAPGESVKIRFLGETFTVGADREQILDLLLSSFEELIRTNDALQESKRALAEAHARELQREQEARTQAEESARRMELLASASAVLSSSLDEHMALHAVTALTAPTLADICIVDTVPEDGGTRNTAVGTPDDAARELIESILDVSDGLTPWAKLAADREIVRVDPLPDVFFEECPGTSEQRDRLRALGLRAALVAHLTARGRRVGTLALLRTESAAPFDSADERSAREIAGRVALAVDNLRLFRQAERDRAAAEDAAARVTALYDSERQARAEAEAATRIRDEVLAIVSHDLRNPLGIIFTGTSLLLDMPLDEEQRNRQLQILKRAAQRMERLISDLLEVSRLESGRLTISITPNRVADLLTEAAESFRPLAEEKGISLVVEAPDIERVEADRERIVQVFSNLVGNAVKFTPEQGSVRIGARADGEDAIFYVADSGPGIDAADLPRIFDRFWQAKTSAQAGAGLGLAIAKGIVEAHRGRIWVESRAGHGATFFFAIPRIREKVRTD